MKITFCGEYRKRKYVVKAEITKSQKIISFNAQYFPAAGGVSSLAILPEKPVPMNNNPLNQKGKKLKIQFCEFLENSYQAELSTIH